MRLVYQKARSRTNVRINRPVSLALTTVHDGSVPERRMPVARCMRPGLSGSSREDGVDVKQTSYEARMEWR
jgi:hypothetical protein